MSMFLLNKNFIEKMDKHHRHFFWHKGKNKRAYHLVKWSRICRSKRIGGLGIKDLSKQNISLLVKWWCKLENKKGLWQHIVRARYFSNKTVAAIQPRFTDSPCWKAIMKVKDVYFAGRKIVINSGKLVRLWHDPWFSDVPLKNHFPVLFDIYQKQECTLADFILASCELPFRRRLFGEIVDQWQDVISKARKFDLNSLPDYVS